VRELTINPKAKALIFDLDGTLADTMPVHFLAYKHILVKYGIHFTPELFAKLAGIPAVGTIEKLNELFGTRMNAEEIGHLKESEYEKIMHKMKPIFHRLWNWQKITMENADGSWHWRIQAVGMENHGYFSA
jgi:beta-phosphoglucomutase-like phosphatase (HAD superfamily)